MEPIKTYNKARQTLAEQEMELSVFEDSLTDDQRDILKKHAELTERHNQAKTNYSKARNALKTELDPEAAKDAGFDVLKEYRLTIGWPTFGKDAEREHVVAWLVENPALHYMLDFNRSKATAFAKFLRDQKRPLPDAWALRDQVKLPGDDNQLAELLNRYGE